MDRIRHFKTKAVRATANTGWNLFQTFNRNLPKGKSIQPEWAPAPILKSFQRDFPDLGFPRVTDSLCPGCILDVKKDVLDGKISLEELIQGHFGEIKADILEENGQIVIRKSCTEHGSFEDILSIDAKFSRLQEERFYGKDFKTSEDEHVHKHGTSTIKYGRGAVLTIDLTNRCNMMCNPCFTDANQVGYVHELSLNDIKKILDNSISFKPRRILQVQFSGGEPTISPHFLEACRYAKEVGYTGIQAATNGVRFALEPEFAYEAAEAGLNLVYFQLDGITNESNKHRHITNLFDVKLKAIENLAKANIWIVPVTTVVNGLNEHQVGPLLQFLIDNCEKMDAISFQPVSFTGRDEEISDELRFEQRYTTSHLAMDLQKWSEGKIDPYRDWFPLGAGSPLTVLADHLSNPAEKFGGMCVSCHPDCGSCIYLVANKKTKAWSPVTRFFNLEQFIHDVITITDTARGKNLTILQLAMALVRNFDESKAPDGFDLKELTRLIEHQFGGSLTEGERPPLKDWTLLWVGGMWFQDLWTYDFRRTEMCSVPYGTQEGEISFCAYNTGIGWRQIIESKHRNATTAEWFKEKGRHKIYSGDKPIEMNGQEHTNKPAAEITTKLGGNGSDGVADTNRSVKPSINSDLKINSDNT